MIDTIRVKRCCCRNIKRFRIIFYVNNNIVIRLYPDRTFYSTDGWLQFKGRFCRNFILKERILAHIHRRCEAAAGPTGRVTMMNIYR